MLGLNESLTAILSASIKSYKGELPVVFKQMKYSFVAIRLHDWLICSKMNSFSASHPRDPGSFSWYRPTEWSYFTALCSKCVVCVCVCVCVCTCMCTCSYTHPAHSLAHWKTKMRGDIQVISTPTMYFAIYDAWMDGCIGGTANGERPRWMVKIREVSNET